VIVPVERVGEVTRFPGRMKWWLALVVCCVVLHAPKTEAAKLFPADTTPAFDPLAFFTGRTSSWGVFENRKGEPIRRVVTKTRSRMVRPELHMEQDLFIGDQPRSRRSWRLRRIDAHHFEGTANDIVGTARGRAEGNTFTWSFTLELKPGNPLSRVRMTQSMYLQPDRRTMINRSVIRKFGVQVAQVTEQFRRE
jgi:hypothetical protein